MSLDEFEIIARYITRPTEDPEVLLGIGDDAAVVQANGSIVIATDTLVEGVHFPDSLDGAALGQRVLGVHLRLRRGQKERTQSILSLIHI